MEFRVGLACFCIGNNVLQLSVPLQPRIVGIHVSIGCLCGQHDGTGLHDFQGLRNSWLISTPSFVHQLIDSSFKILSTAVLLLWALVASRTAVGAWRGNPFFRSVSSEFEPERR